MKEKTPKIHVLNASMPLLKLCLVEESIISKIKEILKTVFRECACQPALARVFTVLTIHHAIHALTWLNVHVFNRSESDPCHTHTHTRSMPCENQRESTANYTIITLFHMHHFFSLLFDNLAFSLCAVVFSLSLGLSSHSMQIHHFEIECKSVHTLFQSLVSVPVNCLVYTDTLMLFAKESNSYAKFKS